MSLPTAGVVQPVLVQIRYMLAGANGRQFIQATVSASQLAGVWLPKNSQIISMHKPLNAP